MTPALLAVALALDAALGEPPAIWRRAPHPAVLMGRLVNALDARLNQGAARRAKGVIAVLIIGFVAASIGVGIEAVPVAGSALSALTAAVLLAQRSLSDHVIAVARSLEFGVEEGRRAVAMIVGRDVSRLDESGVSRAAIESCAENFSDAVIAPAFWYLVAGAPGILVYKAINTADSMIGHRTPRHERFGWAAARVDDLLNLAPARLSAALLSAASLSWRPMACAVRDARTHRSPNAGWPEAAVARALDISLGGPRSYAGVLVEAPWLHANGRKTLRAADVRRAAALIWRAWALTAALVVTLALTGR